MAADEQVRSSHAKSQDGLVQKENALDRALSLKEQFNRAQSQHEHQQSRQTEQSKGEAHQSSKMVKEDKLAPRLSMKGPIGRISDRNSYGERFQAEHDTEKQKLENARKLQETYRAQNRSRDHDHDHDREK